MQPPSLSTLYTLSLALSFTVVDGIPASPRDDVGWLVAARGDDNHAHYHNDSLLVGDGLLLDARAASPAPKKGLSYAAIQLEVTAKFKTQVPDTPLLKPPPWTLKTQCTKCKGKQATDKTDKSKCRNCPDKTKPNEDHTECLRADTGCPDDQVQGEDKKCSKCPAGQAPESAGKKCVASRPDKPRGQCPDSLILDPEVGGQDGKTKNPKCISDDDKKCPVGQSAVSRRGPVAAADESAYSPTCADDADPDHKCDDPSDFDYRETPPGADFKIRHSCRSTKKSQADKKAKYQARVKLAAGVMKTKTSDVAKKAADKAKRARSGWCWVALATAMAWPSDQTSALSDDEVDGLVNSWDDAVPTPPGDGQIDDYVVQYLASVAAPAPVIEASGPGGIATAIGDGISKIFGASIKGGQTGLNALKTGARGAASSKAIQAAKNSKFVQQVLKHDGFRDCVATVALTAVSTGVGSRDIDDDDQRLQPRDGDPVPGAKVTFGGTAGKWDIDWARQPTGNAGKPMPPNTDNQAIVMNMGTNTDYYDFTPITTYHDSYIRIDRLLYETCQIFNSEFNNTITDLEVNGGCCTFYNGGDCESNTKLFSMTNRQDGDLRGASNDAISSWWCTFDLLCAGNP